MIMCDLRDLIPWNIVHPMGLGIIKYWRRGFRPRRTSLGLGVLKINMYYVYIIKSEKNGKLYKGYTEDLKRRLS